MFSYVNVTCSQVAAGCNCNAGFSYVKDSLGKVTFTDTTSGGYYKRYTWDFGDGSSPSNQQSPVHQYMVPGSYNVTLTVKDTLNIFITESYSDSITINSVCTADFNYMEAFGDINFTDASVGVDANTIYYWDLGDASSSAVQNPTHTYATPGTYNTKLLISDTACLDSITKPVHFSVYTVTGAVYDQDSVVVSDAIIYLFETNQTNTLMDTIDMKVLQPSDSGIFVFNNAHLSNNYLLRVISDTNKYADHLSTYYGDVVSWLNATALNLVSDTSGLDIYLSSVPPLMGGNCYVSGVLREGYGLLRGPSDPIDGVDFGIYTGGGDIVGNDVTDHNGAFSFDSLNAGTYNIIPEVTGIPVDSSSLFNISIQNADTIVLNINVDSNNIYSDPAVSIVIKDKINDQFIIFPIPAKNEFNINTAKKNLPYSVSIMDLNGRFLRSIKNLSDESLLIRRNGLPAGFYLIEIMSRNERYLYKIAFE